MKGDYTMSELYKMNEQVMLGTVTLNVKDLDMMTRYYEELIGLDVLNQTDTVSELGIKADGQPLLKLVKVEATSQQTMKAGLFHTAFLLPSRKDLGNLVYSFIKREIPIGGASDHGYSEAIYLQDPENNGIEIYRDKDKSEWDVQENGRIKGITVEMDADGVLASRDEGQVDKMPSGTLIGHVHLSVSDLEQNQEFYMDVLGLGLKDMFGDQARFLAAGDYHHHIGSNTWRGALPKRDETDLGLRAYSFVLPTAAALEELRDNIIKLGIPLVDDTQEAISLVDPNGVKVVLEVKKKRLMYKE